MRRWLDLGVGALLATGVVFAFRDSLSAMVSQWDASPMYSYGYTVPPISAFLIWSRRDEFKRQPLQPARLSGALVLTFSLALLLVGHVGAIQVAQQIGFVIAIPGMVLFLFGTHFLALSAPAVAYLLFMIPIWDAFTEPLHWPFQNNSAKLGVALMQAIGVPVHRDGTFIALPNLLLEVARECSGINYLVAVLALALPLALLRLRQTWRRVLLVISALSIAALANGLRVALIGTLAYYQVGSPLHGPFHVLHGLFVAGIGYVVLFVGLRVLQEGDAAPAAAPPASAITGAPSRWRVGEALALAAMFWTLTLVGVAPQARAVALAQPLETLPKQLRTWTLDPLAAVADRAHDAILPFWSGANRTLARRYRAADGRAVTLDIWYFESQEQGREIISHAISELHRQSTPRAVALRNGTTLHVNLVHWQDRGEAGLFWYELGNSSEANQYATKLRTLWNVVRSGRSNGAAVMLRTITDDDSPVAFGALEDLAAEIQPALNELWSPNTGAAADAAGSR